MADPVWGQSLKKTPSLTAAGFSDDFSTAPLSAKWAAHPAFKVRNGQLVNTSSVDAWNNFLAIPKNFTNPNVVKIVYGPSSDEVGRAFTGAAMVLDKNDTTATGYLIFYNFNQVRLWTIVNGVPDIEVDVRRGATEAPQNGDTLTVEFSLDNTGYHFRVLVNANESAVLNDPDKVHAIPNIHYSGLMVNGNTNNGVDYFELQQTLDTVPPGTVTDLAVKSASASSVTLQWTAPGDDGNNGKAKRYDLRYSTSPIDKVSFGDATPANNIPNPSTAGTQEIITVGGLTGGTTYYFALIVVDDGGNRSGLSNVVSGATTALNATTDDFNRPGPGLGTAWKADPNLQIINGQVQNVATTDVWSLAVFEPVKNPAEVAIKWSATATTYGTNWCGILVMANSPSPSANGYVIQRFTERGIAILWHIVNGEFEDPPIEQGPTFGPAPKAGSVMRVEISSDANANHFRLFIDDQFDREFTDQRADPDRREGKASPWYAGFIQESTLGEQNAIDEFTAWVTIGKPAKLKKVSGDNQIGSIGETLPEPLTVSLSDSAGNGIPNQPINFEVTSGDAVITKPPANDGHIRVEAESARITGPMAIQDDESASGGKYIVYPAGQTNDASATFTINITTAGTYYVWTRSAESVENGSWTIQVDNDPDFVYDVFQGGTSEQWEWDLVSERGIGVKTFNWSAGPHIIIFKARWADTRLDKILITSDPDFIPKDTAEPGFTTDKNGIARANLTFGQKAGPATVRASFGSLAPVTFTATATGGAAAKIEKTGGDGQSGAAGQKLAQPFVVTVRDAGNNAVANQLVSWVVTQGNSTLSQYTSITDVKGQASTSLTLGNQSAANKVEARVPLTGAPIVFTATTISGLAASTSIVSGNGQSAAVRSALPNPVVAKVVDGSGRGVAQYPVEFVVTRGGGSTTASDRVSNGGFEKLNTGSSTPANWSLAGAPNAGEVEASSSSSRSGSRSLHVNSTRNGIGVFQEISYQANTGYVLSFYARVLSGKARLIWQMSQDEIIDITSSATGADWQLYTIHATSAASGSRSLSLKTNGAANFFIDDVKILPSTGGNGQISFNWTLGDTAGEQKGQLLIFNGTSHLTGSPLNISAVATAGAAKNLIKVSGDGQAGSANQPLSSPFVVKVTDVVGINGVPNVNVTFEVKSGGGKLSGNVKSLTVRTNATGTAQATLTLGPQTGAQNTVQVSAADLTTMVTFTATAAIPGQVIKVPGAPTVGSAGKQLSTPLTIRVSDNSGKRISGYPVTFTVKQGNGTIDGSASAVIATDANGDAKAFLVLGPNPGAANRVEATATLDNQPVSGSPVIFNLTAARLKNLTMVSGNNQTDTVGTPLAQPFKAQVLDSLGAGIKNQNVIFKVISGDGKLNGKDTQTTVKTDTLGIASVSLTLGPKPGTNNNKVNAETNPPLSGSPLAFQASARVGAPEKLQKVSGDSLSGVVGNPLPAPLVTKVADALGNPIANVEVNFTVKAGGGKINGANQATVKTQANGQASVTLTLGNVSGRFNNIVEAKASNGTKQLTNSPITFVATATSSRASVMTIQGGNKQEGQAGEVLPNFLVVKVKDVPGNGVPDHPVNFQIKRGDGHFGNNAKEIVVTTDVSGVAKTRWYLGATIKPDSQVVHAIANDGVNPLKNAPLKFVAFAEAGPPSAEGSFIQAAPATIPANGTTNCQITVYVRDQFGNPVSGVPVTILVSGDGNNVKQPSVPTDAEGKVLGSFTSTRAETKTVTAKVISAIGIDITRGASVQVMPLPAQTLIPVGGNSQTGNINTALPKPLSIKVGDRYSNGVPSYEVRYKVEQGGGRLFDPISGQFLDSLRIRTEANGLANVYYICGPTVMENRIRVSAPGLSNSPFLYLAQAVSSPPARLEMVSGNSQQGTVGENLAQPIVARVTDSNNRPVFGVPVSFGITLGDGLINGLSNLVINSDAFGEAKVSWRLGPEAGLNVLRAEANGLNGSPIDFQAQSNPDRAAALLVVSGNPAYGNVNSQSEPLQVRTVDALGNGVDGIGVIFELIEGSGRLTDNYVVSNSGGFASVKVIFNSQSGPRKVRVSADRLSGSPRIMSAFARPLSASTMEVMNRTNNQSGTKAKPVNFPLQVKLRDGLGNPVPGVQINFVVTRGGGNFGGVGSTVATSDTNGIASAVWTLGATPGVNEAKAIKNGLVGSPIILTATGHDNNFPVFEDVPDQRAIEADLIRFNVNATDADNDQLTYEAKYQGGNLPPGAAFDVLTRTFTWQTDLSSAGRHEVSFFARDGKGGLDEEVVIIEVQNRNQPPVVVRRTPTSKGFNVPDSTLPGTGGSFLMRVVASDPDGDILSYRWYRDGVFTGTFTNTFDFTYSPTTLSTFHHVEVLIFDQHDTTRASWLIKVPVELVIFSATMIENQRISLNWKTAAEPDNLGFNILRSRTPSGKYEKINAELIPSRRDGEYEFVDDQVEAGGRYYYKLENVDRNGQVNVFGPVVIEVALPKRFELSQNYPNPFGRSPFNPRTTIRFELPQATLVTLAVYNTLGQEVRRLAHGRRQAGYYTVVWDGRDNDGRPLPSGIYHYRLQAGDFIATKKLVLAK